MSLLFNNKINNNKLKLNQKKMKKNLHNPTMMIKSKFSNDVHKVLEPNIHLKRSERRKRRDDYKFTDEQKIEMFDKIYKLHAESSSELVSYIQNRRYKNRIHKQRVERGYFDKKTEKVTQ